MWTGFTFWDAFWFCFPIVFESMLKKKERKGLHNLVPPQHVAVMLAVAVMVVGDAVVRCTYCMQLGKCLVCTAGCGSANSTGGVKSTG